MRSKEKRINPSHFTIPFLSLNFKKLKRDNEARYAKIAALDFVIKREYVPVIRKKIRNSFSPLMNFFWNKRASDIKITIKKCPAKKFGFPKVEIG